MTAHGFLIKCSNIDTVHLDDIEQVAWFEESYFQLYRANEGFVRGAHLLKIRILQGNLLIGETP